MEYLLLLIEFFWIKGIRAILWSCAIPVTIGLLIFYKADNTLYYQNAANFHSNLVTVLGILVGFTISTLTMLLTVNNANIEKAKLECDFCHAAVAKGPAASIPGVKDCMVCHQAIATDKPEIQKVAAYEQRGEEIPWQRVYGWNEEAHVRFNHAPHIRAEVQCSTCHGDVPQMTVARRVVDHTMGFCTSCHQERKVSNDCLTCHY